MITILLVCLGTFVALSILFALISIVGSTLSKLSGCSKPATPDRYEIERIKLEAMQAELYDLEQRLDQLKPPRRKLPG